jgi:hypothetical protein
MTKVCTYDNPATMARECWSDGVLRYSYSVTLLESSKPISSKHFFFGANIGPWKTGQLVGDSEAMRK